MRKIILSGIVEKFEGNGRKLGYPTANIRANTELEEGVYFGFADLGIYKKHPALIFIGTPTTVGKKVHRVEAHLLNAADIDYYGQELAVHLLHFHRSNQHFRSIDELISVMKDDEKAIKSWLRINSHHKESTPTN